MQSEFSFKAIAHFQSTKKQNLEASCQGILDTTSVGAIDISSFPQWKAMLQDLHGFSHLWVVFVFDRSGDRWKPMVLPPRSEHKVGVFASRSPYRPNPIGISAVKIDRIEGPRIFISGHDLVDETPILDIKPYLPYADSFPEAELGWVKECKDYEVLFSEQAERELLFLKNHRLMELKSTLQQQLRFYPTDKRRKRVTLFNEQNQEYVFSYRTWRIKFCLHSHAVTVLEIYSGYSPEDLKNLSSDLYQDKTLHLHFLTYFSKT